MARAPLTLFLMFVCGEGGVVFLFFGWWRVGV